MRERDAKRAMQLKSVAQTLKKVLPDASSRAVFIQQVLSSTESYKDRVSLPPEPLVTPIRHPKYELAGPSYEIRSPEPDTARVDTDYDDDEAENTSQFGKTWLASPYNKSFLDIQYGIRKDGDSFKIGDSTLSVDDRGNLTIKGKEYRGTEGLWELLTRKKVKRENITTADLRNYKSILERTNAHKKHYEPGGNIHISRGAKYRDVISKLFVDTRRRGVKSGLRRTWLRL